MKVRELGSELTAGSLSERSTCMSLRKQKKKNYKSKCHTVRVCEEEKVREKGKKREQLKS